MVFPWKQLVGILRKKKLLPIRFFREMFVSDVISVFLIFSDAFLPGNSVNKAEKVITTEYFS